MEYNQILKWFLLITMTMLLLACGKRPWNDPYPAASDNAMIYYASFSEQPKTLDPANSYSSDETLFIAQIYEPPLQYHYLKRPYTLVPLVATTVPQPVFLDAKGKVLPANTDPKNIIYSFYDVHIRSGIYYQPHPAFAKNAKGDYEYFHLTADELEAKHSLADFPKTGTRELVADDFVYEIKRLASPSVQSPIYGLLSKYIVGFTDFHHQLEQEKNKSYVDLRQYKLAGVFSLDRYTYRILIYGYYPQFIYWLAMPFFAPLPWEADAFYSQVGMSENDITLDWYPVGTGPFFLEENNPNRRMVLTRNPNFHGELYLAEGEPGDAALGLLAKANQPMPFINKFIFSLEKESIPRWTKFLQGYYDQSAVSSDSFDQAIRIDSDGNTDVTHVLKDKGIRLQVATSPSIYYFGFNMLDPIVGGSTDRARKLRQAISIALDYEEYISIFLNGRGVPAQGPLPPGIYGYRDGEQGINSYVYQWIDHHAARRSIIDAKKLLQEAGYGNGRDPNTGQPLLLNFDIAGGGSGDDKALFAWMRKQFAKLGIELQIRDTQYNRFQEKVRTGQAQMFIWGWLADYPDPENFLFLLYGPNGKVRYGGENATNYSNPLYDKLFIQMRDLPNGDARQAVIDQMIAIVRQDSPWAFGYYPLGFSLTQSWVNVIKPNEMANNTLKYLSLNPKQRVMLQEKWNQPIVWPVMIILLGLLIGLMPMFIYYWRKQHLPRK